VSRTYKGCGGYAPIFAYLGQEGYGIHVQLRVCLQPDKNSHSKHHYPGRKISSSCTTIPITIWKAQPFIHTERQYLAA